jgi:EAL domain-containing protein (putative c-di-GMP-specific phosphodiesterase class I)
LDAAARPVDAEGQEIPLGGSVGVALYPMDGHDADTLVRSAETALYRAMAEAPGHCCFFAPGMDAELAERRRLEGDLRKAVERRELMLHYQPQVDAQTGRIIGFEALLRWPHEYQGMVMPGRFVPIAEDAGLIAPIGEWVLEEACRQARIWADAGLPSVPVAVNVSAMQFKRHDLPGIVARVLRETRLPPSLLEVELTESAVMHDADDAVRQLAEIKALGVRVSIDDFGTGYSSLSRLRRTPVDKLKIDRSFVAELVDDPNDAAIARAIISLGHSLGLKVVSEGVETQEQLDYLRAEGCDGVQGYFFSKAVPPEQAARLLKVGGF